MKFAAWRKVLSIFLLAVFLCAVPSLLTACSRSPASGSTELLDSTQLYFIELGRLVPGFEQPMLDSFREAAEKLDACVKEHDAYFAEYPDAKAAFALMVQLPDVLEQNLGASEEDGYDLRQLPQDWYSCVIDLWRFVYPGVYGAKYSTKAPNDADLLKWLADDGFSDGSSPCWTAICSVPASMCSGRRRSNGRRIEMEKSPAALRRCRIILCPEFAGAFLLSDRVLRDCTPRAFPRASRSERHVASLLTMTNRGPLPF